MSYRVEISRAAAKDLRKLPSKNREQVVECIDSLAEEPRNQSVSKLTDREEYRSRTGDFRILFKIFDDVLSVLVLRVLNRKDAYK